MTADNKTFKNQVAIVTGASSGIGRAVALDLLERGASVAGVGRRPSPDGSLSDFHEYGTRFLWVHADVSQEVEVRRMVRQALKKFGQVDILVNNAGVRGPTVPVPDLSLKNWDDVLATNLTGAFLCARECAKHMLKRRHGRIVNISSTAGRMAYPYRAAYAASKWGLIGFTLTLAQEVGSSNILVNAICPGPVEGSAIDEVIKARAQSLGVSQHKVRDQFLRSASLRRMVTATDVSRMVLFLCSKDARNITGQVIDVSAGFGLSLKTHR
jgi:NAD(P)-dependent dehydrogenase (short-subunit alcohol dehydrogenase family)